MVLYAQDIESDGNSRDFRWDLCCFQIQVESWRQGVKITGTGQGRLYSRLPWEQGRPFKETD